MMTSLIIVAAVAFVLILHRILENILCSSGDSVRRKFYLEISTAAVIALSWITVLILTFTISTWRSEYLGMVMLATPFIVIGVIFFSYLSYIVYHQDLDQRETEF